MEFLSHKGSRYIIAALLVILVGVSVFFFNSKDRILPASETSHLSEWHNEYILTFNKQIYVVTQALTNKADKVIGDVSYHGTNPGFFKLYSIKNVEDYSTIAVETKLGYQVAIVEPDKSTSKKQDSSQDIVSPVKEDPRTSEFVTKLKDFSFDYDKDNKEEKIVLYTAAGRNEKGEIMWDDGQNWLLVVVDDGKYYKLFSGYVQLGDVFFDVSTVGEKNTSNITVLINTHCGLQVTECFYNKEKDCFEITTPYDVNDKNVYFNSFPGYK